VAGTTDVPGVKAALHRARQALVTILDGARGSAVG